MPPAVKRRLATLAAVACLVRGLGRTTGEKEHTMTRVPKIIAPIALAFGFVALLHGQTTRPADAQRLEETAKEFGMTPQELDRFVRQEVGDPIVVDGDLIVGVRRDANGRVSSVQITTPARDVRFNRSPDAKNPGLRYSRADLTDTPNMAAADDIDGDGRIDRIMLTPPGQKMPNILLRIGADFVRAKPVGDGKMQTTDGRTFTFDASQHEWVAAN
jgi:hypothetical protein